MCACVGVCRGEGVCVCVCVSLCVHVCVCIYACVLLCTRCTCTNEHVIIID